tara:strand:- start:182 stop:1207 length:1026 start_codon:yes stop_codon:yes gene_type:complete
VSNKLSKKIAIIGGGIIGCLSAIKLRESGFAVVIVEKNKIGEESSWAGAGILFPLMPWAYSSEVYSLCESSSKFYEEFSKKLVQETGVDPEFFKTGMKLIEPKNLEEIQKWSKKNSYEIKNSTFNKSSAILFPFIAQIRPPRLMKAISLYINKIGIDVVENTELCKINNKEKILNKWGTKKGDPVEADYFLVTSGAWVSMIRPEYKNIIYPIRGQMIQYKASSLKINHILYFDGFYVLQRKDGVIIAGSTVEEVGFDKEIKSDSLNYLKKKAEQVIPALKNILVENHWVGFRPGTKNNIPIIGKDIKYENVYINSGHFRYGITMAPKSAEIINSLLVESKI